MPSEGEPPSPPAARRARYLRPPPAARARRPEGDAAPRVQAALGARRLGQRQAEEGATQPARARKDEQEQEQERRAQAERGGGAGAAAAGQESGQLVAPAGEPGSSWG